MAQIRDLDEQKQALSNIVGMIKDIQVINQFLQADNPSGVYEIGFSIEVPRAKKGVGSETDFDVTEEHNEDANSEDKKKAKKSGKTKKFVAPFTCDDASIVRKYVLASKKEKVQKIRELSQRYNIELDEEEESIVRMFEEEM